MFWNETGMESHAIITEVIEVEAAVSYLDHERGAS